MSKRITTEEFWNDLMKVSRAPAAKPKTLVLAGNAREAQHWARTHNYSPNEYTYIHSEEQLRGRNTREQPRVNIGSCNIRTDSTRITESLSITDMH